MTTAYRRAGTIGQNVRPTVRLDESAGFTLDGTNAAANDAAWDVLWASLPSGARLIVPAGAQIAFAARKVIDKFPTDIIGEGAQRHVADPTNLAPTARFVAAAGIPHLFSFEGSHPKGADLTGSTGDEDNSRGHHFITNVSFDGAGLCTDEIVLVNCAELRMTEFSFHGLSAGTARTSGDTMFAALRLGPKANTQTTCTNSSGNTFTKTAHGYQSLEPVEVSAFSGNLTGLTSGEQYYIIRTGANTFQLATTYANARAGTAISLPNSGGTCTVNRADNVSDCYIANGQIAGELANGTIPRYTVGIHSNGAADCEIQSVKPYRCDVGFYLRCATNRLFNCHPFSGGIGNLHGYAGVIIAGQGNQLVGNYFDNAPADDEADKGAHVVVRASEAFVTSANISANIFNNGDGGTDTKPAIRIEGGAGDRCVGLVVTGNNFSATGSRISHQAQFNGTDVPMNGSDAKMNWTGATARLKTSSGASSTWTTFNANGSTASAHLLVTGKPIRFTQLPAGETTVNTTTTYYVRSVTANTFTIHSTAAGAIANTGQVAPSTTAGGDWKALGYRVSSWRHVITAGNWADGTTGLIFANNNVRWLGDPQYDTTSGEFWTRPLRPFGQAGSATVRYPPRVSGNTYSVGTDITASGSANLTTYVDDDTVTLTNYTASSTSTLTNHNLWAAPRFSTVQSTNSNAAAQGVAWVRSATDTQIAVQANGGGAASCNYLVQLRMTT